MRSSNSRRGSTSAVSPPRSKPATAASKWSTLTTSSCSAPPDVEWDIVDHGMHQTAMAEVDLGNGPITLELRCGTASLRPDRSGEDERRERTAGFWSDWAQRLVLPSVEPEMVRRSALTLKALCYGPTGAILAAATTSLPELVGGVRQWDYRYCWIRDASLSAAALVRLGSIEEAMDLLDWLLRVIETSEVGPERLSPLYTVNGQSLPPEATIEELSGYAGSRPVRIGNAADHQVQLDVFGPVLDLIHRLGEVGAPLVRETLAPRRRLRQRSRQAVDRTPTRASGRSGRRRVTARARRSCAGSRSTGPCGSRTTSSAVNAPSGSCCVIGSRPTSSPTAGATMSARSPPPTTAATSMHPFSPSGCSACCRSTTPLLRHGHRGGDLAPHRRHRLPLQVRGRPARWGRRVQSHDQLAHRRQDPNRRHRGGAVPLRALPRPCRSDRAHRRGGRPDNGRGLGNHPQAYSHLGLINNACTSRPSTRAAEHRAGR